MYLDLCISVYRYAKLMQGSWMLAPVKRYKFSCMANTTENFLGAQMFVLKHPINPMKFLEVWLGVSAGRPGAVQIHGLEKV